MFLSLTLSRVILTVKDGVVTATITQKPYTEVKSSKILTKADILYYVHCRLKLFNFISIDDFKQIADQVRMAKDIADGDLKPTLKKNDDETVTITTFVGDSRKISNLNRFNTLCNTYVKNGLITLLEATELKQKVHTLVPDLPKHNKLSLEEQAKITNDYLSRSSGVH